ncbi:N-acetylmuramoyl-L-alanine amidase [Aurantimonas sp. A3-2-R12]|uniref:N-acetylmuramoyl-L-alanine amidase n=1 Tax=Aurantimonas sp. A3-2-R12 TaxID=3114362 RepID=UPI002E187E38|nr:N-acetylmuramoyl-L-alanine amidase [Aurantimonas sp. A3-2-R12]
MTRFVQTLVSGCRGLLPVAVLALLAILAWRGEEAHARDLVITGMSQSAEEGEYSASFVLRGKPQTRILRLANPDRIAVDFIDTLSAASIAAPPDNGIVESIRHGLVSSNRYRFIFRLKREAFAAIRTEERPDGQVIVLSIQPSDAAQAPVASVEAPGAQRDATDSKQTAAKPERKLTIVLDPGHGGIDNGAVSSSGTHEKEINLQLAFALRDSLLAKGGVKVVLTREDDTFIPLDERAAAGRRERADLFISIHADSIRQSALRGATVYTLSETASDELSRQVAAAENASDRFAGEEWQKEKPDVFDILLDLTRRETVSFSEHFATSLVHDLATRDIRLINRPKRSAGFKVLKAPDVPSVLVEFGFLSNRQDEKLLQDDAWREEVAAATADAVMNFFGGTAQEGRGGCTAVDECDKSTTKTAIDRPKAD